MDPTLSGLIGAGIGALAGFLGSAVSVLGTLVIQGSQREIEKKSLASAFYGEIGALLEIVRRRQYIENLEIALDHVRRTNTKVFYSIKPTKEYFNVFNKNIDKIGLLPSPLPEKIVSVYILAFSILEDVEHYELFKDLDVETQKANLENLLTLFRLAVHYSIETRAIIEKKRLLSE